MGGDQISKVVIEQDRKMHKYHFKYWGGDHWKCYHCNFRVDWSIRKARLHSKIHLNKGEERFTMKRCHLIIGMFDLENNLKDVGVSSPTSRSESK